ncbi:Crp/Fnr family transcriptional regulator [Nitrospirillum sp. BR 11163]|uniref:Crp/Fnr family transcriptional regulator n=1 Tax=Nitrospirillum sp. BR 11163 TaxID=3104323 RepID=UPI002AFFA8EB|nr:helix-turn-helix domain-containing protein [Nitrospirillum sp. BR 11163]MEA1676340.1 helix-turn-helix domain-containing protein [Nitrospirillum sp. BR 11163]
MTADVTRGGAVGGVAARGIVNELAAVPAFAGLAPDVLSALSAACRVQDLGPGDVAVRQGITLIDIHILLSGTVMLVAGNAEVGQRQGPETTFLLAEALTGAPAPVTIRAVGETRLLAMPLAALRVRLGAGADLALSLMAGQAARERVLVETVAALQDLSLPQRLAAHLLKEHNDRRAGGRLDLDMGAVAAALAATPEDVAWTFTDLRRHGVALEGTTVVLKDFEALRALATPGPVRRRQAEEWPVAMWDVDAPIP